jgi:hypothetical protein
MRAAILAPLALFSCGPSQAPRQWTAQAERARGPEGCTGLRVISRLDIGGAAVAVAHDGQRAYAATESGVEVHSLAGRSLGDRIPSGGEPADLAFDDGTLWIADGSGGILRVSDPSDPARRTLRRWEVGGDLRRLRVHQGWLWAADASGRVLALPLDAEPTTRPLSLELDGWPSDLLPWGELMLVAAREGGLMAARLSDGDLIREEAPAELPFAGQLATGGEALVLSAYKSLVAVGGSEPSEGALAASVQALDAWQGFFVAALGPRGLARWDGHSPTVEPVQPRHPLTGAPVEVWDFVPLDGDTALVAAGNHGVARIRPDGDGWLVEGVPASLGSVRGLVAGPTGPIVATKTDQEHGWLVGLEVSPSGALEERWRLSVPVGMDNITSLGDELLLGGVGLTSVDLSEGSDSALVGRIPGIDEEVSGVAVLRDGGVAALAHNRGLLWLEGGAREGWRISATSPLGAEQWAMRPFELGHSVALAYSGYGLVKLFQEPGGSPTEHHLLAGQPAYRVRRSTGPSGGVVVGDTLWLAIPGLGLESLTLPSGRQQRIHLPDEGALDVASLGTVLAAARGLEGVALVDPGVEDHPLVASCNLPGLVRWVLPLNDGRLLAANSGSVFLLEEEGHAD